MKMIQIPEVCTGMPSIPPRRWIKFNNSVCCSIIPAQQIIPHFNPNSCFRICKRVNRYSYTILNRCRPVVILLFRWIYFGCGNSLSLFSYSRIVGDGFSVIGGQNIVYGVIGRQGSGCRWNKYTIDLRCWQYLIIPLDFEKKPWNPRIPGLVS